MGYKMNFHRDYVGPKGPHLSCLTQFTIDGKDAKSNTSIHPRAFRHGRKVDTSKPAKRTTGPRAKAAKELDRRRRDREATVDWIKNKPGVVYTEGMYKTPGSMKL